MKHTVLFVLLLGISACGSSARLDSIRRDDIRAQIQLPDESRISTDVPVSEMPAPDTITVTGANGERMILMKAIRDDDGEMVANEVLNAAVVTARFRNVAERHGRIALEFDVIVPSSMQNSEWQLRFNPYMHIMGDTLLLDPLLITGKNFRMSQLRGYQQYERFLKGIVSDTMKFVDMRSLELFLQRNIPAIYAMKKDTSAVSDAEFEGAFGVSGREALEHFTNLMAKRRNFRKSLMRGRMFEKYVKSPILASGVRLDTVLREMNGNFRYRYVQDVYTRPGLKKIDIVLAGEIEKYGRHLYSVPACEPLNFYVSSLSSFVDKSERFRTEIVSRKQDAHFASELEFPVGKAVIDENLGDNASVVAAIKACLRGLLCDEEFDVDGISVTSFASPEGAVEANMRLCRERGRSASLYFSDYVSLVRDSIRRERGIMISFDPDSGKEVVRGAEAGTIRFRVGEGGEHWALLDSLVGSDPLLSRNEKEEYSLLRLTCPDDDECERLLRQKAYYPYLKKAFFPRLRQVRFDFSLVRRGMLKDTIQTTVPDMEYMHAVRLLEDRHYEEALEILLEYGDYNTAVASLALDRNHTARSILEKQRRSARVNYLMAVVHSRFGEDRDAVQCYLDACAEDGSYIYRGNLDPEISSLISRYGLKVSNGDDNIH